MIGQTTPKGRSTLFRGWIVEPNFSGDRKGGYANPIYYKETGRQGRLDSAVAVGSTDSDTPDIVPGAWLHLICAPALPYWLRNDWLHDLAFNVRKPKVATLKAVG